MKMTVKENEEYYELDKLEQGKKYNVSSKQGNLFNKEMTCVKGWSNHETFLIDSYGNCFTLNNAINLDFKIRKPSTKVWLGEFTEEEIKNLKSLLCRCHDNSVIRGIFNDINMNVDLSLTNNMKLDAKTYK